MIIGYIGLPGMGKTFSMVWEACHDLKEGRRVIANLPIIDTVYGTKRQAEFEPHIADAIKEAKNAIFCIDEASIVLPNYFWNQMPMSTLMRFAQVRKYGLDIYYTSQGWNHTVKRLRDLTNYVVRCSHTRLGFFQTYLDPEYFSMKTPKKFEKEYTIKRKFCAFFDTKKIFQAYNTLHVVETSFLDSRKNREDRYPTL